MGKAIEIERGTRLVFNDGDKTLTGNVNGDVYAVAFENEDGSWDLVWRVPVWTEERGPLDVAGSNVIRPVFSE